MHPLKTPYLALEDSICESVLSHLDYQGCNRIDTRLYRSGRPAPIDLYKKDLSCQICAQPFSFKIWSSLIMQNHPGSTFSLSFFFQLFTRPLTAHSLNIGVVIHLLTRFSHKPIKISHDVSQLPAGWIVW